MPNSRSIAFFISPHGFGHAARSAAILQVLNAMTPELEIHIFTRVPRWFFDTSLSFPFHYHDCLSDIGLVQSNPLDEDLQATIQKLSTFIPFHPEGLREIAEYLQKINCQVVVCDISPFGIAAAQSAGIPSVLVENFTWDWIYSGYLEQVPEFSSYIAEFQKVFRCADAHIQTQPVSVPDPRANLITNPVARPPRVSKVEIRRQLHIPMEARLVLLTMGGFELKYDFLGSAAVDQNIWFVIPGGAPEMTIAGNLVLIPHHSNFYHPDLVHASDAVVSKAGYSTISEVFYAGIPFGYVSRDNFRESPVLSQFIQKEMKGLEIDGPTFQSGNWVKRMPELLQLGQMERKTPMGADQAARFLFENYLRPSR